MDEKRAYYEAYEDRYRQVHGENLRWFTEEASPIVGEMISEFKISVDAKMLELGCGEGRDAKALMKAGYSLLATDISETVINFCRKENPEFSSSFQVLDCVRGAMDGKFDFLYAVAVVHMLVTDADRDGFYRFVREHLTETGIALICTMGDGETERQSDISTAFDLQERIHEQSGKTVFIAGTSCRMVSFDTFAAELGRNGLFILKQGITVIEPDFPQMMYAAVKRA